MNLRRAAERLPLLHDVNRRKRLVLVARAARRVRRRTFERVGSERYSHPEIPGLLECLDFDNGFFVEAGANDGHRQSNTYYLERFRGWQGLLIEPIPELWKRCVRERPRSRCVNYALIDQARADRTITLRYDDLGSRVLEPGEAVGAEPPSTCFGWDRGYDVTVQARTLSRVLDEIGAPHVDFLSLDVEGFEEIALGGLDLQAHRPTYILVEAFHPTDRLPRLERLFGGRYELLATPSEKDLLFRSLLVPASARPPPSS
jgi:FkbM family methyltransferase